MNYIQAFQLQPTGSGGDYVYNDMFRLIYG